MRSTISLVSRHFLVFVLGAAVILGSAGCGRGGLSSSEKEMGRRPSEGQSARKPSSPKKAAPADASKIPPAVNAAPPLELKQEKVTLTWVENGEKRMSARGREVKYSDIGRVGSFLDFSAQLYENGKLTATVKAPKAVADTVKRVVTASGGVTLKSLERNTVVKAQWIKWFEKEQRIVGNGGVKITSDTANIEGAAFTADTAMKNITVTDSVKGL